MKIRELMNPLVETVTPDAPVSWIATKFCQNRYGCLVVVQDKTPVGIVTETDLLQKVLLRKLDPDQVKVGSIMSTPVITVDADSDLEQALELMHANGIKRLPVVSSGELVGILTQADLMALLPLLTSST